MVPMQGAFRNQQRNEDARQEEIRRKREQDPEFDRAETVRDLSDAGLSVAEIARKTGMTQRQVRYFSPSKPGNSKS